MACGKILVDPVHKVSLVGNYISHFSEYGVEAVDSPGDFFDGLVPLVDVEGGVIFLVDMY